MANATAERNTVRDGESLSRILISLPMAAALKIFKGTMVAVSTLTANVGQAVKGGSTSTQKVLGIALDTADNTSGAASAINVPLRAGAFWLGNSAAADAITAANIGQKCYAVDDQTVALTSNAGARPLAGVIEDVSSTQGVLVAIGEIFATQVDNTVIAPVLLPKLANAAVIARFTPGFAGKIKKLSAWINDPVTTGAKAGDVQAQIAAVATTGGVVTLTSANSTPIGAKVDGTAITALNNFGPTDEITLVCANVTAFVEGSAVFNLELGN